MKRKDVQSSQLWLAEAGPTAALMACLFAKYAHASLSLEQSSALDQSVFSAMLASVLFLSAPLACISRNQRFVGGLLINFILTALLTADRIHLQFFGNVISVAEFSHAWQVVSVASSVLAKLQATEILYYADIFVAMTVLPIYLRLTRGLPELNRSRRIVWSSGLIALGLLASVPTLRIVYQDRQKVFEWRDARRRIVGVMGFLPYHLYDLIIHVGTMCDRMNVTESERERVHLFINERRQALTSSSPLYGVARGRDLIIVMAESLHAFALGLRINGQAVTPRLDAFSAESLRFVNFYDQTYEGATSDAEFTSLQSLHPIEVGAIATRYQANQYRGLPAILAEKGYSTLAAIGQPGEYWNMREMRRKLGFQRTYFDEFYTTAERFGHGVADIDFFAQTLPVLTAQAEPFMAFLVTLSNHHPYNLPAKHRILKLGDLEGTLVGEYLHSVHYFDRAFGEFVDRLRETGLLDKSMVVVYGDHQAWLERPPELAWLLRFPEESKYHYWKLRKKLPFLIRLPDGAHAGVRTVNAGHLDVSPTLLSLLGITDHNAVMLGTDLTRGNDSLVVFRDGSFADGKHYFINARELKPYPACYEVQSNRQVSCANLETQREKAMARLETSDLIIKGNLVPALTAQRGALKD